MNEREADQADVRPFLPRPGEPVEEYAERLRAMYRDLSVVLQAVERGLARAGDPVEHAVPAVGEPAPEPVHAVHVPAEEPAAAAGPLRGLPRVEVMPSRARTGHRAGDEGVQSPWVDAPLEAEPLVERRQPSSRPDEPRWAESLPPARPLAERPSLDRRHARVEAPPPRIEEFTPATIPAAPPPPAPQQQPPAAPQAFSPLLPQWAVAAILAGWLTIVALLLALLLESG